MVGMPISSVAPAQSGPDGGSASGREDVAFVEGPQSENDWAVEAAPATARNAEAPPLRDFPTVWDLSIEGRATEDPQQDQAQPTAGNPELSRAAESRVVFSLVRMSASSPGNIPGEPNQSPARGRAAASTPTETNAARGAIELPAGLQAAGSPDAKPGAVGQLAFTLGIRGVRQSLEGQGAPSEGNSGAGVKQSSLQVPSPRAGTAQPVIEVPSESARSSADRAANPISAAAEQASEQLEPAVGRSAASSGFAGRGEQSNANAGVNTDAPATPSVNATSSSSKGSGAGESTSRPAAQPPVQVQPLGLETEANNRPAGRIEFQLRGENNSTANVSFVDRGGQVQVTVRAPDPNAVQSLRAELQQLSAGLENQGYQVRVSTPSETSSSRESAAGSQDGGAEQESELEDGREEKSNHRRRDPRREAEFFEELL